LYEKKLESYDGRYSFIFFCTFAKYYQKLIHINFGTKKITMENILVTGADGFIGSHLTEMLLDKGIKLLLYLITIHLTIGVVK
jgi:hypothetical protein